MRVHIAENAGACYGVERALNIVLKTAQSANKQDDIKPVHTLGPLIHNPQVVSKLEREGVGVADEVDDVHEGTVIIRTHGVPPQITDSLGHKGLSVVDATCPYVKKVHKSAKKLTEEGYFVIIVGDADHAEVQGIAGYCKDYLVTTSVDDLVELKLPKKVGVVVQTTQSQEMLDTILCYLSRRVNELRVFNTICEATNERQAAARKLSLEVDAMIVIGGKNSGNTRRLHEISKENCANAHHIETADELEAAWFEGVSDVGVTAGASTPQAQISTVVEAIENL